MEPLNLIGFINVCPAVPFRSYLFPPIPRNACSAVLIYVSIEEHPQRWTLNRERPPSCAHGNHLTGNFSQTEKTNHIPDSWCCPLSLSLPNSDIRGDGLTCDAPATWWCHGLATLVCWNPAKVNIDSPCFQGNPGCQACSARVDFIPTWFRGGKWVSTSITPCACVPDTTEVSS